MWIFFPNKAQMSTFTSSLPRFKRVSLFKSSTNKPSSTTVLGNFTSTLSSSISAPVLSDNVLMTRCTMKFWTAGTRIAILINISKNTTEPINHASIFKILIRYLILMVMIMNIYSYSQPKGYAIAKIVH